LIAVLGIAAVYSVSIAGEQQSCFIHKYSITTLLISGKSNCENKIEANDLLESVMLLNSYWDWNTSNEARYKMLAKQYRDQLADIFNLKDGSEYRIPGSEWERIWRGYTIEKIEVVSKESIQIEMILSWQQEGYEGVQSYIFSFRKEGEYWKIISIIS
jgi:hypothetical protein